MIGLEMAAYFNSIGSEITVIEMLDHIAGENDRELVGILQKHYEKRGMKLLLLEGKLLCEPSSAIGIGAVLRGQLPVHKGDKVCFVISGGSVALEQLHRLEDVRL